MAAEKTLLEERLGDALRGTAISIATAESCTSGLIAHRITNVAGSSEYFEGAVVAYSNEVKRALLGVKEEDLVTHGAVSEIVARQMAEGARATFQCDLAVAVTGIAGPGGGSPEKPVGLVYVALASDEETIAERNQFSGNRDAIKSKTADRALKLLLDHLS